MRWIRIGSATDASASSAKGFSQSMPRLGQASGLRYLVTRERRKLRSARAGGVSVTISEY